MSLRAVIADIQGKTLALGIKGAPTDPPEAINQFPFAVTYAAEVEWERVTDWKKGLQKIVTEIHWSRQNLPAAISQSVDFGESFANAILRDPRLSNTVDTIVSVRGKFGFLQWGGQSDVHIGWSFEIVVKMQSAIT